MWGGRLIWVVAGPVLLLVAVGCAPSSTAPPNGIQLDIGTGDQAQDLSWGIQALLLLTVLSLAPAILVLMTSFTRIIIVLSFVRTAMGVPQLPPNQILLGLALFLTVFVMAPVWQRVNADAVEPYLRGELAPEVALERGLEPVRTFMFAQTREKDLSLFVHMSGEERPRAPSDVPTHVLIPAFVISELRTGFEMGFIIFIPFLIIDMVVSSTLMSMGMVMLPPVVISLPFKVLLFVLADGWHLVVRSVLISFV